MHKSFIRKLFTSLFLFLLTPFCFSQIRDYVGVVRQQYFPEHIKYFENYRDELKENGSSTYANYVDSYLKGTFGSGFVYVAADGTNYVITNRHVVSQAASASIEFEDADSGELKKYENLTVLLTDDEIDIAILGFKDGEKPFKKGLTLSSSAVSDGQEVWSAGFPGLGSSPVWQLGKGTVTNARARIKDLLDPAVSPLIQHSAQVDGGNSGGPLMISSSKGTAGYEVAGINTWKATYRDSTNFAIPSSVILTMINKAQKKADDSDSKKALEERSKKLAEVLMDLSGNFTSVAKYISYERASTQGQKDFDSVLHFAPSKVRSSVLDAFSYDPAEGLRYACAYQLWKKYSAESNDGAKYSAGGISETDGVYGVEYTSDSEKAAKFTLTWKKEHGLWRIEKISSDAKDEDSKNASKKSSSKKNNKKTEKSESSSYFESPEINSWDNTVLSAGVESSLNGKDLAIRVSADFFENGGGIWGTSIMFHSESVDIYGHEEDVAAFGMGGGFRVPVKMGSFGVSPYAKIVGNLAYGGDFIFIGYAIEAGAQFMFNCDGDVHFGFGAGFKQLYLKPWMDWDTDRSLSDIGDPDSFMNRALSLYAVISF